MVFAVGQGHYAFIIHFDVVDMALVGHESVHEYSIFPLSLILNSIGQNQVAFSMAFVFLILPFVIVAVRTEFFSMSFHHTINPVSFVFASVSKCGYAFSLNLIVFEIAFKIGFINEFDASEAFFQAMDKAALVLGPIFGQFHPLAMFQVFLPLSVIVGSIRMLILPLPIEFIRFI